MRIALLLATTLSALPIAASAQTVSGPYVSLGVGANFMQDEHFDTIVLDGVRDQRFAGPVRFDVGFASALSAGWGFGNGLRVELEGNYRYNTVTRISGTTASGGLEQKYGGMGNLFYDFDLGLPVVPYVGVGVGEQTLDWRNGRAEGPNAFVRLQHADPHFAYQAMIGAAYPLPIAGLSATAEYRFMGSEGQHLIYGQYFAPNTDVPAEAHAGPEYNHAIMFGLRYAFNAAPPAPAPAPAPVPQAAARTYLVFFDWDKADLTPRARQVIAEAAQATTRAPVTRIEVSGYTDTSGTARYNQALSVRRAEAVAMELVRLGVPRAAITAQGFGETHLLVPTANGVREPQNRRVEIVLR